jgi:hypothetical protein
MLISPAHSLCFIRVRIWMTSCLMLASVLVASSASAAPTFLQYQFDETNSSLPNLHVTASAAFSGQPSSGSSTGLDIPLAQWVMPQLVLLSEDRQSAEFSPSVLSMQGAPIGGSGEFDLGFSGRLPYSVSVSSLSIETNGTINPLQADATLRFAHVWFTTLHLEGSISLLGATVPFSLTQQLSNGYSEINGGFTPSDDPAQIAVEFGVNGLRDSVQLYATSHAGFDLGFDLTVGLNTFSANPTVVPEPGSALLIGLGLVLLGAARRS